MSAMTYQRCISLSIAAMSSSATASVLPESAVHKHLHLPPLYSPRQYSQNSVNGSLYFKKYKNPKNTTVVQQNPATSSENLLKFNYLAIASKSKKN